METQTAYTRQAVILRKNLMEWDRTVRGGLSEDWPKSLGRLNAALNQTVNMDKSIVDVMEHFVYLPRRATANPQDIPFFLSTRLEDDNYGAMTMAADDAEGATIDDTASTAAAGTGGGGGGAADFTLDVTKIDPVRHLTQYEKQAAELATEYERQMVRF